MLCLYLYTKSPPNGGQTGGRNGGLDWQRNGILKMQSCLAQHHEPTVGNRYTEKIEKGRNEYVLCSTALLGAGCGPSSAACGPCFSCCTLASAQYYSRNVWCLKERKHHFHPSKWLPILAARSLCTPAAPPAPLQRLFFSLTGHCWPHQFPWIWYHACQDSTHLRVPYSKSAIFPRLLFLVWTRFALALHKQVWSSAFEQVINGE